jgi:hypothetical protein
MNVNLIIRGYIKVISFKISLKKVKVKLVLQIPFKLCLLNSLSSTNLTVWMLEESCIGSYFEWRFNNNMILWSMVLISTL